MISYLRVLTLAVVLCTGSGALLVSAQTTTPTSTASTFPTATTNPTSTPNNNSEVAIGTTSRTGLNDGTQRRVTNLAANIANRIDATNARLMQIATRLERRIEKTAATGADTNDAQRALQAAYTTLTGTAQAATTLDQHILSTVTSENPYRDWLTLRDTLENLKQDLQTAKAQLLTSTEYLQTNLKQPDTATSTTPEQSL